MLWTLDTNGEATDWLSADDLKESFVAIAKFSGTPTLALEVSNDDSSAKADAIVVETYQASFAKIMERPLPRRFRWKLTAWTGGQSVVVSIGKSHAIAVHKEGSSNSPTGDF